MFNLQGSEIIFILLIALVVLGPEKLPDAVRRFTNTYNELRKMGSGLTAELRQVIDEPTKQVQETAAMLREAATPDIGDPEELPADAAEYFEPDATADAAPADEAGGGSGDGGTDAGADGDDAAEPSADGVDGSTATDRAAEPAEPDDDTADEPPRRVNTIAAANSSAGLAARAAAMERARQAATARESGTDEPTEQAPAPDEAASA